MRFVPTKELEQQDIQALHRVRERLVGVRTALVNEVHGPMSEYGIVIPKGVSKFRKTVVGKLESEKNKLTPWLTDKTQPPDFSSRFLVFKDETRLATHGLLLFRCHGGFGVRFTA
jgi:hypothetical protein